MTKTLVNQELLDPYWELTDEKKPIIPQINRYPNAYGDRIVEKCTMDGNGIVSFDSANKRRQVKDIKFINSKVYCSFSGIEISGVEFVDTKTGKGPMFLNGCIFRHVKFSGKFGSALINPYIEFPDRGQVSKRSQEYLRTLQEVYKELDWAIDITEVVASCFEVRGSVPGHLVRHNKFDQLIMDREVAKSGIWKTVPIPSGTTMPFSIDWIADSPFDNSVLVAAKRSKSYRIDCEYLHSLKTAGYVY